jgi:hypothetical protein
MNAQMNIFGAQLGGTFFDQQRSVCPPTASMSLVVQRSGKAGFKITAPGVELTEEMLMNIRLGFVIDGHRWVGRLTLTNLRHKGRALVYP